MCNFVRGFKESKTTKDRFVYKVLMKRDEEYFFPYRTYFGEKAGVNTFNGKEIEEGMLKAKGFKEGFGFHAFETVKTARVYIKLMKKKHTFQEKQKLVIVRFFVPEKTDIRKGTIKQGWVGAGLKSIAVDKMLIHKEVRA
jgi:hypothetical protein